MRKEMLQISQIKEEFCYNAGTDLLLNWGRNRLEFPDLHSEKDQIEQMIATWETEDLRSDATDGVAAMTGEIETVKQFFQDHVIIPSDSDDPEWLDAVDCLAVFDRFLFFWSALTDLFKQDFEQLAHDMDACYNAIADWCSNNKAFTPLRLIPLNPWRKKRLASVPADRHHMYPWLYKLVDVDSDAINMMTDHWNDIKSKGFNGLWFLPEKDQAPVWFYLNKDAQLKAELDAQHFVENVVVEALDDSIALRLLHLSTRALKTRVAPEAYIEIGLTNLAHAVLTGKTETGIDGETLFSALVDAMNEGADPNFILAAGFCAPRLTDKQRLQVLKHIEKDIKNPSTQHGEHSLFSNVEKWRRHDMTDPMIIDAIFSYWDHLRQAAYERWSSAEEQSIGALLDLPFPNSWATEQATIYAMPGGYNAEPSEESVQMLTFRFDNGNVIGLLLKADDKGHAVVLEPVEDKPEFNEFLKAVDEHNLFIAGWRKTDSDIETIDIEESIESVQALFHNIAATSVSYIVFGVSGDYEILEKAMANDEPEGPEESEQIVWVIYRPEETP